MRRPENPQWLWDQQSRIHYLYNKQDDTITLQDGRRMPRPPTIPRNDYVSTPQASRPPQLQGWSSNERSTAELATVPQTSRFRVNDSTGAFYGQTDGVAENSNLAAAPTQVLPRTSTHLQPVNSRVRVGDGGRGFM